MKKNLTKYDLALKDLDPSTRPDSRPGVKKIGKKGLKRTGKFEPEGAPEGGATGEDVYDPNTDVNVVAGGVEDIP